MTDATMATEAMSAVQSTETQIVEMIGAGEAAPETKVKEQKPKGPLGRPSFTEGQKAFKASIWASVVFGKNKVEARQAVKEMLKSATPENRAVLNSAMRSIEMRGRTKKAKVAKATVTETVEAKAQESAEAAVQAVVEAVATPVEQPVVVEVLKAAPVVEAPQTPAQIQETVDQIIAKMDQGL